MTYGKMMSNSMKYSLSSTVLYNNGLAIVPMFALGVCVGSVLRGEEQVATVPGCFLLSSFGSIEILLTHFCAVIVVFFDATRLI